MSVSPLQPAGVGDRVVAGVIAGRVLRSGRSKNGGAARRLNVRSLPQNGDDMAGLAIDRHSEQRETFRKIARKAAELDPLQKRVTISDVAKLCGVTPATVSRVLNGKRKFRASEEVRQRITSTAQALGYQPDLAARNLNRKATRIIGIFASPRTHMSEGITDMLLEGLTDVLRPAGYDVFFDLSGGGSSANALPFWRFDGAVVMQAPRPEAVAELDRRRVPYVCVNEQTGNPVCSVLADDEMGMFHAVDYLKSIGHKKIAYAGAKATYLKHYSITVRPAALAARAAAVGLELAAGFDAPISSVGEFLRRAVVADGATAVICYDHHIAVELVSAAHTMGLKIPENFSLLCYNDAFPVALLPTPLTAIAVNGQEMGRIGAQRLLNVLSGSAAPVESEIRVREEFVLRASTAPPRH